MKRLFHSATFWRLALVATILTIVGIASTPPVLGSGPTLAVTEFANNAGASQSTVNALSSALYQSVNQSGKFSAVGGGPLHVTPAVDRSIVGPAISEASKAGASELVVAELISASGGNVVYRLTAYRVAPLDFIRTQIFSQSSLASSSLTAGFVTNLSTLHAPHAAIGTIYSVANGIHADLGSVSGFQLGQQFNVMRNGQKMGQAQITGITANDAVVQISNPVNGYQPQVGDSLVGLQPMPAVKPAPKTQSTTNYTIWGVLIATGAALLAIGHHGQPATPSGVVPTPTPTSGAFMITNEGQSGVAPSETFTFTFSQPVNTSSINFSSTTQVSYTLTNPPTAPAPVTGLQGTQMFDATDTTLTITSTCCIAPGQQITFSFTSSIISQLGVALTPTNVTFTVSEKRHPAARRRAHPATHVGAQHPKPM